MKHKAPLYIGLIFFLNFIVSLIIVRDIHNIGIITCLTLSVFFVYFDELISGWK